MTSVPCDMDEQGIFYTQVSPILCSWLSVFTAHTLMKVLYKSEQFVDD